MNIKTLKLATISLMATLSYVAFTFLQIKIPTPGGFTSFHLGNTFCVLAALLLGGLPGGIAGAIGMGIGDILDPAYITVAPKTILLKLGIGIITGVMAHHVFHVSEKETFKSRAIFVTLSASIGMAFNIVFDPILSFFYSRFILGVNIEAATILANWNAITTSVNAVATVICATIFYLALYPRLKRSRSIEKLAPKRKKA